MLFISTIVHYQQQFALAQINSTIFKMYENSAYGIKIKYPSDWKKVEPSQISDESNFNIIVGFLSPKESASYRSPPAALSVGIHNLSPSRSVMLDQYTNADIKFIRQQATVLEEDTTTLNATNTLAHKVVYINSEGQKVMQVWTIKGDKAYHITYAANESRYSDYLLPVQKMIDSFEIVSLPGSDNTSTQQSTISNSNQQIQLDPSADIYTTTTTDEDQVAAKTKGGVASSNFNFAAAGDWGCTDDTTNTVNNMLDKNPELVLGLGDYSYDEVTGSADCWLDIIQPIDNSIDNMMKIVIGNHDTADLEKLLDHFDLPEQYYSFDYHNVHFIALGTEEEYLDMSNDKAKEQLAFVKSDLEKASTNPNIDWIIPFFHRIMYYDDYQCDNLVDEYDHNLVDVYHPLFEKYGVKFVLQAHAHTYERTYPLKADPENSQAPIITSRDSSNYRNVDGLVIAGVGTGGAKYTQTCLIPELAAVQYENLFGFLNVDVSSDGKTLVGTFYDNEDGEVRDQFTITKSSTVPAAAEEEEEEEEEEDDQITIEDESGDEDDGYNTYDTYDEYDYDIGSGDDEDTSLTESSDEE
jgi:hypothetical protein